MRKKNYPHERQEQSSLQLGKETSFNISQQMHIRKPLPQIYSYNRIPNTSPYIQTEQIPLLSHNSITNIHRPRIRQHPQYLTQQSVPILQERLKSIQEYYDVLIKEQKNRSTERSEVILEVIDEMQASHLQKVQAIRKMILQSEEQKRDVGFVDEKMTEIKGNIEDLIDESNTLKIKNQQLEKKIQRKRKDLREKEYQLDQLSKQLLEARGELESFEVNNLKNNKINREILQIFNSASSLTQDD